MFLKIEKKNKLEKVLTTELINKDIIEYDKRKKKRNKNDANFANNSREKGYRKDNL